MNFTRNIVLLGSIATIIGVIRYKKYKQTDTASKAKVRRKRKIWVKDIYLKRQKLGFFHNLVAEMRLSDPILFFNFCRMTRQSFDKLLSMCNKHLIKHSPREAIEPAMRLMVTLRFVATGDSYPSLGYAFRIHPSTVCNIIRETCSILWDVLSPLYLPPLSEDDWLEVAESFYTKCQFPNCLGSIDGKHIRIQAPENSGSTYFNYKKYFSIILLAICDANYKFTYVDIGSYGAQSDGGILKNSIFGKKLMNGQLNIPKGKLLPHTNESVPLYFIGDEAFPLLINLLRPYSKRRNTRMPEEELIFNYRLSRARRVIENTFGIMVARFRIFHKAINAKPETVDNIVKAVVCLHNFCRSEKTNNLYCYQGYVDKDVNGSIIPGDWRKEVPKNNALQDPELRFGNRNAPRSAWQVRDFIKDYVNGVGSDVCPWQQDYVRKSN